MSLVIMVSDLKSAVTPFKAIYFSEYPSTSQFDEVT